jgi:hypothetical protein
MKGGRAIYTYVIMVLRQTTKILSEENVAKRTKRMALMPDDDFEGDFLEVEENIQGIVNATSANMYYLCRYFFSIKAMQQECTKLTKINSKKYY